jgi:hypothetical protein
MPSHGTRAGSDPARFRCGGRPLPSSQALFPDEYSTIALNRAGAAAAMVHTRTY